MSKNQPLTTAFLKRLVHRRSARASLRNLWGEVKISAIARRSPKAFNRLRGRTGIKMHLGCAGDIRPGWVNVDLAMGPTYAIDPSQVPAGAEFINHDLRLGLPLEEGSCDLFYSSHFFEHLDYTDGTRLMRDCYRALRPGGVFRISLPDLPGIFAAYLRGDKEYFRLLEYAVPEDDFRPRTLIDFVNFGVYQADEHKAIYDVEKLTRLLTDIGFTKVVPSEFQQGMDPDSAVRRAYSFYMEATK